MNPRADRRLDTWKVVLLAALAASFSTAHAMATNGSTSRWQDASPVASPPRASLNVRAVAAAGSDSPLLTAQADTRSAEFQALADEMVMTISDIHHLYRELTAKVLVVFVPEQTSASMAVTMAEDARGGWISSGDMERCLIVVHPNGQALVGEDRRLLMALEVFNCFQTDLTTVEEDADRWATSAWLTGGASVWAAKELAPGSTLIDSNWGPWVLHPEIPLFDRTFDALGFFAHMAANQTSPWGYVDQMLRVATTEGNAASFDVAAEASHGNDLIDTWGPSYFRLLRPQWQFVGRGIPAGRAEATVGSVGAGGVFSASVAPYAALPVELEVSAEVVEMVSASRGRALFSDLAEHDLAELNLKTFCTLPGGCTCPPGSPREDAEFEALPSGELYIGMTGHHWGGKLQLVGWTREEYCGEARTFDGCLVGTWSSQSFPIIAPGSAFEEGEGVTLTFDTEGAFRMDFSTMQDAVMDAGGDEVRLRLDGAATGHLEARNGVLQAIDGDTSDLVVTGSIDLDGTTVLVWDHVPLEEAFGTLAGSGSQAVSFLETTYRCEEEMLEYDTPAPGVVVKFARAR